MMHSSIVTGMPASRVSHRLANAVSDCSGELISSHTGNAK